MIKKNYIDYLEKMPDKDLMLSMGITNYFRDHLMPRMHETVEELLLNGYMLGVPETEELLNVCKEVGFKKYNTLPTKTVDEIILPSDPVSREFWFMEENIRKPREYGTGENSSVCVLIDYGEEDQEIDDFLMLCSIRSQCTAENNYNATISQLCRLNGIEGHNKRDKEKMIRTILKLNEVDFAIDNRKERNTEYRPIAERGKLLDTKLVWFEDHGQIVPGIHLMEGRIDLLDMWIERGWDFKIPKDTLCVPGRSGKAKIKIHLYCIYQTYYILRHKNISDLIAYDTVWEKCFFSKRNIQKNADRRYKGYVLDSLEHLKDKKWIPGYKPKKKKGEIIGFTIIRQTSDNCDKTSDNCDKPNT